jgi:hypothetical protein
MKETKRKSMTNILTMRNLNFTIRKSRLDQIKEKRLFKDMVELGALMNAIEFCRNNDLAYQLATMQMDYYAPDDNTIALTGGLLHDAMRKAQEVAESYPEEHYAREMRGFVSSFKDYRPQKVPVGPSFLQI